MGAKKMTAIQKTPVSESEDEIACCIVARLCRCGHARSVPIVMGRENSVDAIRATDTHVCFGAGPNSHAIRAVPIKTEKTKSIVSSENLIR